MKKITLDYFSHNGRSAKNVTVFLDKNDAIVLLPSFYSLFLSLHLQTLHFKDKRKKGSSEKETALETKDIREKTFPQYINQILHFLTYLEEISDSVDNDAFSVHSSQVVSNKVLNNYLNQHLIEKQGKGLNSAQLTISAINGYYAFLASNDLSDIKYMKVANDMRKVAAANTRHRRAPQYITKQVRQDMVNLYCKTIKEKCVIQCGYQMGLRTEENRGLLLNDFSYGKKKQAGLLSLFKMMDDQPEINNFEYYLQAHYTKTNKSRTLYIPRGLLVLLRDYYNQERPEYTGNDSDEPIFLCDSNPVGHEIPSNYGTTVFRVLREQMIADGYKNLDENNTYHHLRHTFGTELFYEHLDGADPEAISHSSNTMRIVAERLGHSLSDQKRASRVTEGYVRSFGQMMVLEGLAI